MSYHTDLATYVEQISDDFQSTLTVVDKNTLANMMGFPDDFDNLTSIVKRYIPTCDFKKPGQKAPLWD